MKKQNMADCLDHDGEVPVLKLAWVVNIWTKGQVVIPKEVRESLNLSTWDSLAIFYSPNKQHIGLVKNDDLQKVIDFAKSRGIDINL